MKLCDCKSGRIDGRHVVDNTEYMVCGTCGRPIAGTGLPPWVLQEIESGDVSCHVCDSAMYTFNGKEQVCPSCMIRFAVALEARLAVLEARLEET